MLNNKIRARNNIIVGTWNVRTLRAAGKLEELTHEMNRYLWNILGLCEVRWKNFGETSILEGHKLYFSGREDKHQHGVGSLSTFRLRATPFNFTIIQAYAPTSDYDDEEV